ncbi:LacI family DNA-binding transcriptional regulator [Kribbella sp. NPDC026611]|uniref:LacI family DNA-binding transcriptional regulator n=1 Tax=Kribbella sp. NPDC026611 TaxID=3154911 RepID=UPI0033C2F386
MTRRVTIAQVAAEAGVSAMTVSNVVNGRSGASEQTRRRVLKVAERLGYVPNLAGRSLKSGRTGLIGVLTLDLTTQYALEIVRGISDELAEAEYEVLISASYQDATREQERVARLVVGVADGVVLVAPRLEDSTLDLLRSATCPVIVVDPRRFQVDLPRIVVDNYGGMRQATDHLLSLGHERIAYLGGDPDFDSSASRRQGFLDSMRLAGKPVDETLLRECDFTYQAGLRAAREVLAAGPTAIVAGADLIAVGAVDAVRAAGGNVPSDVSVVGFDDLPRAAESFPSLTTVRQPLHDMGQLAIRHLMNRIDGRPGLPELMTLPTELIVRGSTAPPAGRPSQR